MNNDNSFNLAKEQKKALDDAIRDLENNQNIPKNNNFETNDSTINIPTQTVINDEIKSNATNSFSDSDHSAIADAVIQIHAFTHSFIRKIFITIICIFVVFVLITLGIFFLTD